ncbi:MULTISPECIES: hypothetical protein [unclassified Bradyrhizobium]|uniref:hypothetical protein n=1 Tax=unclassified Bradyrhizobium TaxID=2631580 RepID=UPI0029168BF3|nr:MULTISPECIES: hypothetical protein [unclassified Bradyrhizobium]
MPITHQFQSGRGDNGDPGAVQPSHWDALHVLTGTLAALDQVAPTPNVFFSYDGNNAIQLVAKSTIATIFSPAFTGVPTAPTALQTVNSTQIATTEYVQTAITNLIGGAPGALNTLNELAIAINGDASFSATVTAALGVRLRVDAAQGLNGTQQAQGRANLGLGSAALLTAGTGANNALQLDGSAKLPAVDGSQLTGVLPTGALLYGAAQVLTDAQKLQALANLGVPFECGRLVFVSATALRFAPFYGDLIKIWGQVYRIPSTGIVGLSNSNAYVNGVAGQALAPNTLYYVYAFMNAVVMTADFCTTGHAPSAAGGNVGTETISGGNDSRSLIGMVYTNGSAQFSSALVATWFNRRTRALGSAVVNVASPGQYPQEIGGGSGVNSPGLRVYFLVWGDESEVEADAMANVSVSGAPVNVGAQMAFDGAVGGAQTQQYVTVNNNQYLGATGVSGALSEGLHYAVLFGGHNAGTVSYASAQTMVSGVRG